MDDSLAPIYCVKYGEVQVFRRLNRDELIRLCSDPSVTSVEPYEGETHFYPNCGGVFRKGLSRALTDTTCRVCLTRRANDLAGWRWTHPINAEEVRFLLAQKIQPTVGTSPDV